MKYKSPKAQVGQCSPQDEVLQCSACPKSFATRGRYNQHLKTHTKPFRCTQCTKGFALRLDLTRHVQARHRLGVLKFPCGIGNCAFKASRKDNLPQHQKIAHGHLVAPSAQAGNPKTRSEETTLPPDGASSDPAQVPDVPSLFDAASCGNVSLLQNLLQSGIDLSSRGDDESTALHCAARAGSTEAVRYLLYAGAQIESFNTKWRTPAHEAAISGDWDTLQLLMRAGADIYANDKLGKSTITYLAETGNASLVSLMVQYCGREIMVKGRTNMLHHAAKSGHEAVVQLLLSHPELDVNARCAKGYAPIHYAVKKGHIEVVRLLAAHSGFNLNVRKYLFGYTVLEYAAVYGQEEIVRLLLSYSAVQFRFSESYPEQEVRRALRKGHISVAKLLIEDARVQKFEDSTPLESGLKLLLAVLKGSMLEFVELHRNCSPLNINPEFAGFAPLNWAIALGQTEMAKILLADSRTNIGTVYGSFAPLDLAAKTNNYEILGKICEHAQKDAIRVASGDLLHRMIAEDNYEMLSFLLKRLDVNGDEWVLKTLLHAAVNHGNMQTVKMLLEYENIKIDRRCYMRLRGAPYQYVSPLEVARRKKHTEIVELLLAHGATDNAPTQAIEPNISTTMQEVTNVLDVESNYIETSSDEMEEDMDDLVDWEAQLAA